MGSSKMEALQLHDILQQIGPGYHAKELGRVAIDDQEWIEDPKP
jgi:hypothetical protein